MAVVLLAAGGSIAWLLWPEPPPPPPAPTRLTVAGQPVPAGADPVADALDLVRRYAGSELTLKLPNGSAQPLRAADLGAEIDRVRLAEIVRDALRPGSAAWRAHQQARARDPEASWPVPIPLRIDAARALDRFIAIKDELDRPASDAMVDLDRKQLLPETWGFRLDVYATLARVEAAFGAGAHEVDAVVEPIKPRVIAAQLGNVEFGEVLGYFETRYSKSAKYKERTYNLRLAASRLDGTVLLAGETFDFNEKVGPRDEAHGYKVAPVIAQGELVDGLGGGTCQISGTLHGAAFFAGLDIVERYPHSRPSHYIKLGLDATVVYPTINFRLKNPFDHPVVLHETVRDGVVRAEVLGPKRKRTVSFFRRVDEVLPFEELERETDALPRGERQLGQRGVPGFKTTVLRVVRDGAYAVRTQRRDQYPPTTQIVLVGTGDDDAHGAHPDDHPEYVADEYLVLTQGPDIRTPGTKEPEPGGGTIEWREAGKTGRAGWQKEAGMKVFEEPEDEDEDERDTNKRD